MKESIINLEQFLLVLYKALKADDSVTLKHLITQHQKLLEAAANEKYLLVEAFSNNAQRCFKILLDNLDFESKESQIKAVEDYIVKRMNVYDKLLTSNQLDCVQLIDKHELEDKIFERNAQILEPTEHIVYFRAFLRSKAMSPTEYLPLADSVEAKSLCLKLLT